MRSETQTACRRSLGLWPLTAKGPQIMVAPRLNDPLTADQLRTLLDYSPELGVFVWRKREPLRMYDRTWNTRYAGKIAGTPTVPKGYIQIMVNGELYLGHRLAYLWMTGKWPEFEIDHHDCNPANNKWDNLRAATSSQGKMNTRLRSDNVSGYKGVRFEKRRNHWIAIIHVNGVRQLLGSFPTAEAAKAARDEAARKLHGAFARHD